MGKSIKILIGAAATSLITIGVAAQTGTVKWPQFDDGGPYSVQAGQVVASPSGEPTPSPSPTPTP